MDAYVYECLVGDGDKYHAALVPVGQQIERGTSAPYPTACGRQTMTRCISRDPFLAAGSTRSHCRRCRERVFAAAERGEIVRE